MVVGVAGCTDAGIICTAVKQKTLQNINYKLLMKKRQMHRHVLFIIYIIILGGRFFSTVKNIHAV